MTCAVAVARSPVRRTPSAVTFTGPEPSPPVALANSAWTTSLVVPVKRMPGLVKERPAHDVAKAATSARAAASSSFSCSALCRHHNPAPAAPATRTTAVTPPTTARFLMCPSNPTRCTGSSQLSHPGQPDGRPASVREGADGRTLRKRPYTHGGDSSPGHLQGWRFFGIREVYVSEPTNGSAPGGDVAGQSTGAPADGTRSTESHRRRSDRHAGTKHRHPWLRRAGFGIAGVLVVALVLGVAAYVKLNGNIQRLDISSASATARRSRPRPTGDQAGPLNIFVMGSDSREGTNLGKGQTEYGMAGSRSDTNLIVHLSADRQSAIVVSIPRDSMTKAPRNCKNKNDKVENGVIRQWNQNFTLGGPACTIRTFEGLTGIFIDHFVVIDFRGFQSMVDALGGVTVCLPEPIEDRQSHLNLPAGKTKVNGKQRPGLRAAAPQPRRRVRPGPDRPPAGVPVLGDPGGHQVVAAAAAGQAVPLPQRDHLGDDHRHGR